MCVCVWVCEFKYDFNVGRYSFQMDTFLQISPPKFICRSLLSSKCYLLHRICSILFDHTKNILSNANHESSHRSNSTLP